MDKILRNIEKYTLKILKGIPKKESNDYLQWKSFVFSMNASVKMSCKTINRIRGLPLAEKDGRIKLIDEDYARIVLKTLFFHLKNIRNDSLDIIKNMQNYNFRQFRVLRRLYRKLANELHKQFKSCEDFTVILKALNEIYPTLKRINKASDKLLQKKDKVYCSIM